MSSSQSFFHIPHARRVSIVCASRCWASSRPGTLGPGGSGYARGLGAIAWGGAAPTANAVSFTIGGVPASVQFSGMTGAGLYQFNLVVPNAASGDQLVQA